MAIRRTTRILLVIGWIVAFALAVTLDERVAGWVRRSSPFARSAWFVPVLKLPGNFFFTLAIGALLILLHPRTWRAALPLLISGPLVGLGYMILKWIVGRRRPIIVAAPFTFHPFAHGLRGLVHAEAGLSFPSGHAALAFATATCLSAVLPRWTAAFFLVACAVGAERILENAHYVSDVVAGAGVGMLGGMVAIAITDRWFSNSSTSTTPVPSVPAEHHR